MKRETLDSDWLYFVGVTFVLGGFILMLFSSDFVAERYSPALLLYEGFALGIVTGWAICWKELKRFRKQVSQLLKGTRPSVRMPMALQTLTLEEFRKMWGERYPDKWRKEEEN